MKMIRLLVVTALLGVTTAVQAQLSEKEVKQRKEMMQKPRSLLDQEASLLAQKEAKKLKKKGWQTAPGALPLEKMLDKSYELQMEYEDNLLPKYFYGEGLSTGENYDAAKMQAIELAKIQVVTQIQTELTALIETNVGTKQISAEEAVTATQTVMAAKELISQNLGRYMPVVEAYRVLRNKNKEVLVRIAYNNEMAKAAAKAAARKQLEDRGDQLQQKLDELLGW